MDIKEVKERKLLLESTLLDLLVTFQNECRVNISDINIEHIQIASKSSIDIEWVLNSVKINTSI